MKKLLFMLTVLTGICIQTSGASGSDDRNGIQVMTNQTGTSGENVNYTFHFASNPVLTYINEFENYVLTIRDISITSSNMQEAYGTTEILLHQDDVKSIKFVTLSETGINNVSNEDINVTLDGQQVSIAGLSNGETVQIYSTDGKKLLSSRTDRGKVSLQLPAASPGTTYIVKCGGTFKLRIR